MIAHYMTPNPMNAKRDSQTRGFGGHSPARDSSSNAPTSKSAYGMQAAHQNEHAKPIGATVGNNTQIGGRPMGCSPMGRSWHQFLCRFVV